MPNLYPADGISLRAAIESRLMRLTAPAFWYRPSIASRFLYPLSLIYRGAGWLREYLASPRQFPAPVICIGSPMVGGSGKTPTVQALYDALEADYFPLVVSRGYRGQVKTMAQVPKDGDPALYGDEAAFLAQLFYRVYVGRNRAAAIDYALEAGAPFPKPPIILVDDGLQNPSFAKTASLIVVDGKTGFGNGLVLPAGPLREPWEKALLRPRSKAQAVLVIGADESGWIEKISPVLDPEICPVFQGHFTLDPETLPPKDTKLIAFAGLGRPGKFFDSLKEAGCKLAECVPYPDHHVYGESDLAFLSQKANDLKARLITTQKDAVKLPADFRQKVSVASVRLDLPTRDQLVDHLLAACDKDSAHSA